MRPKSRFPDHRKQAIRSRLESGVAVLSNDLAAEFGVSEDAVRRDLRALAQEGVCERVYGGALPRGPGSRPLTERMKDDPAEKISLATRAISLVRESDTLFLDSSSTNLQLAKLLPGDRGIRVVTNSVLIAAELIATPDIETNILGGRVNAHVGGRVDCGAINALAEYSIDLCFLGACACDLAEGLAAFHRDDAAFKRALIRTARSSAIMLTTAKLGTFAPYRICQPAEIATYILSQNAPALQRDGLAALGPTVLSAPLPS